MDFHNFAEQTLHNLASTHELRCLGPQERDHTWLMQNDILGLQQNESIRKAGEEALRKWGSGPRASRLLGGNNVLLGDGERAIASYFEAPTATFFSSGYLANLALSSLGSWCTHVYSDEKNHASLIDAVRLMRRQVTIVPHTSWPQHLTQPSPTGEQRLLLSESLFSMDATCAPIAFFRDCLEVKDNLVVLDEAHATGLFELRGQGLMRPLHPSWERLVIVVAFGKACGVGGAALLGTATLQQYLHNFARSFIFTTAPLAPQIAMVQASLHFLASDEGTCLRQKLWQRASQTRAYLHSLVPSASELPPALTIEAQKLAETRVEKRAPFLLLPMGSTATAMKFCSALRGDGIYLNPIRYPTVPRGKERVRLSISLHYSDAAWMQVVERIGGLWKAFLLQGLIPASERLW